MSQEHDGGGEVGASEHVNQTAPHHRALSSARSVSLLSSISQWTRRPVVRRRSVSADGIYSQPEAAAAVTPPSVTGEEGGPCFSLQL